MMCHKQRPSTQVLIVPLLTELAVQVGITTLWSGCPSVGDKPLKLPLGSPEVDSEIR